jgi:hypothetical protein
LGFTEFVCSIFNAVVSNSDYLMLNDSEKAIRRDKEESGHGIVLRFPLYLFEATVSGDCLF